MKRVNLWSLATLTLVLACGMMLIRPATTWAKPKAFLQLPGVVGECQDKNHKGWIEVESFSWGVTRSGTAAIGSGATGRAAYGEIKFTKIIDRPSPLLAQYVTNGHSFPDVKIETWRPDGKPGFEVFVMQNVRIIARVVKAAGQPRPIKPGHQEMEEVTLSFQKIDWNYSTESKTSSDNWTKHIE